MFFGGIFMSALVLVPASLVEFRYFTLPLLFLNFGIKPTKLKKEEGSKPKLIWRLFDDLSMNLLVYWAINLVIFYVFMFRPYNCYDNKLCRFIW